MLQYCYLTQDYELEKKNHFLLSLQTKVTFFILSDFTVEKLIYLKMGFSNLRDSGSHSVLP